MIKTILIAGATGYIGGRLAPRLIEKGYKVRCLARHPSHIKGKPWAKDAEILKGDILKGEGLSSAFKNIDAAFYLVHSMADTPDFEKLEEISANNFAKAAKENNVKRIVYMGGLGDNSAKLSRHLKSRHKVGDLLRSSSISITEFRAAIIVGSGSVSFEMIRYLVERLPVILSFKYLQSLCQPTAIRDVLSYLINCLEKKETENKIIEVGGASVHPYTDLLKIYAETRGLKRRIFNCRLWLPNLFSKVIGFITPIPSMFAMPLLESLSNDVVCKSQDALKLFPEIKPLDYRTAVKYALMRISENAVETTWAMSVIPIQKKPYAFTDKEGMSAEERHIGINAACDKVFKVFTGIGGARGWFYANWLWTSRAWLDLLLGGVGMRRSRRHTDILRQGEPLDFWRVERVIEGRLILLRAEMKLPGKGWLEFEVLPIINEEDECVLRQTAYFEPKGLFGNIYWYGLYPLHKIIFAGLIREIKQRAEK